MDLPQEPMGEVFADAFGALEEPAVGFGLIAGEFCVDGLVGAVPPGTFTTD